MTAYLPKGQTMTAEYCSNLIKGRVERKTANEADERCSLSAGQCHCTRDSQNVERFNEEFGV